MISGFVMQIAGFVICAAIGEYTALVAGRLLSGAGLGFVTVSANSDAATEENDTARAALFASISAGVLGGVTVGAGIGSVVQPIFGFGGVFAAGAVVAAIGAAISAGIRTERRAAPVVNNADYNDEKPQRSGGFIAFLAGRGVSGFLILLLAPFMLMLSFRDYFFPLFSAEVGISETDIGRIYLLCGMAAIYLGPRLTELLIAKLGEKNTTMLASALAGASALIFAFVPNAAAAIAGVVLLTAASSFGYAAQSAYYTGLKATVEYGESRAMGVYSIFDNGGQMLGPIVYAFALSAGNRGSAVIMGGGLICVLVLYMLLNRKKGE
jgi:predicted MFS family arabinose efflux permease